MNKRILFTLALLATFILFSLYPLISGQGQNQGYVSVSTDTEMIGVNEVSGGGHITWTFTGEKARELRANILQMFDNASTVPPYFVASSVRGAFYLDTKADFDGNIDEDEASTYLESVDRWLETSFSFQDRYRYYVIGRADTLYEEVSTSTRDLIDTNENTDAPVVIRFIFNSEAPPGRKVFQLAETESLEAIYDIFSVRMLQDFEDNNNPFSSGQWKRTTIDNYDTFGSYSFWHGNETTERYENDATNISDATIDLSYASYGNISFRYRGSVADVNDALDITISDDGIAWQSILRLSEPNNTAEWKEFSFDLSNFTGQKAYLRLNFTSDAAGAAEGFFIDTVNFDAPCIYDGQIRLGYVDYIVGLASFSDPYVTKSSPHVIRLLGGEILLYSATYDASNLPGDRAAYDSFNAVENPAILFIVMFICLWFMVSFPNRFYSDYKLAHEPSMRFQAEKIAWLHWLGRIMILLLLLFYFFPTMFAGVGLNVFIGGGAMIILSIVFLLTLTLGSKFLYDRKIARIPAAAVGLPAPPLPGAAAQPPACLSCLGEVNEADSIKCECGVYYHPACAAKLNNCQSCGSPLKVEKKAEELVPVSCPSCSEMTLLDKSANLAKEKCPHCSSVLKSLEGGYNYFIIDKTPDTTYAILNTFIHKGTPALCLSTRPKEKLGKEYDLGEAEIYWVTTMSTGDYTLDPKRLDFEVMRVISQFMKENKGGIVLIDGVEYLIAENGFEVTSAFLKKVSDMASVNNITFLVPMNPSVVEKEKLSALRREFDKEEVFAEDFEEEPKVESEESKDRDQRL